MATIPPTREDPSELRLVRALRERKERVGSYSALARAIALAQREQETPAKGSSLVIPIDRRKLRRVLEGEVDSLTVADLRVLDRYLEVFGEGLAFYPLFEKPALLQSLAECRLVNFLIGSRSFELRQNFSHWDLLGLAEMQRLIQQCGTGVRFDIREVSEDMDDKKLLQRSVRWRSLVQEAGPSLVCLGSCRTIPAAESMIRAMFGGKPFGKDSLRKEELPFHFVWSRKPAYVADSPFHIVSDEIKHLDTAAARQVENGDASVLKLGDRVLVDQVTPKRGGEAYGICVAQRRGNGQIWVLVAGIAGVATYVTAKQTKNLAIHLPEVTDGKPSGVYWSVVRVKVPRPTARNPLWGIRDFPEESIFDGPNLWTPGSA